MAEPDPSVPPVAPPPGLLNTGTTAPGSGPAVTSYTPAAANSATAQTSSYTPEAFKVTPDQTVASQLKGIIDSGSPLMQQAEANARAAMNRRGLLNSSQAITAGQSAVIGAALPIAQSDAATYERAATNTTGARNTALASTAAAENTAGLQNAQLETQTSQINAGAENTALQAAANASNTTAINNLNNASRERLQQMVGDQNIRNIMEQGKIQERLTEIEAKNKVALQTSASSAQLYNQAMANIGKIMDSTEHDYAWKMAASNNIIESLNASLETMSTISNIPGIETTLVFA